MAYDQRIANGFQYQPSRRDPRTLADLVKTSLDEQEAIAAANGETRRKNIANDDADLDLEKKKALQAGIISEAEKESDQVQNENNSARVSEAFRLAMGQDQTGNLPPHLVQAGAPQVPPFIMGQGQPNGPQILPPPLASQQDPYAAQQSLMDERSRLLDRAKNRSLIYASAPELGAAQKAREANLSGRENLAADRMGLSQSRDFAATVPELEAIKNGAVATMKGADRDRSIDAWNGMISAIQSAVVAKNPSLLQNKGFQEYMQSLEKLKPAPPPVTNFAQTNSDRQATQQVIGLENQLRDEYEKGATESRTIGRAGQDIAAALATNNALSIRTAVTKFSKISDPTTGVLGNEANATEQAAMGDLLNQIEGNAKKISEGGLTEESKENFKTATRDLMRVQKAIFQRVQDRTKNRFKSYQDRFPGMKLSLDAVMGAQGDRDKEVGQFDIFADKPSALAPDKAARLQELRAKKAAGTLK